MINAMVKRRWLVKLTLGMLTLGMLTLGMLTLGMLTLVGSIGGVVGGNFVGGESLAIATPPPVYPPGVGVWVSTDRASYEPGAAVLITTSGCNAGTKVEFSVMVASNNSGSLLTATADATGVAALSVTAPAAGRTVVEASCAGISSRTAFSVVTTAPRPTDGPRSVVLGVLAVVFVAATTGYVATVRRRAEVTRA